MFGCCGRPRERTFTTAAQIAEWCHDAWPVYLWPSGPFRWLPQPPAFGRFAQDRMQQLEVILAAPFSTSVWYVHYNDARFIYRRFGWFDGPPKQSAKWVLLQAFCQRLADQALRFSNGKRQE